MIKVAPTAKRIVPVQDQDFPVNSEPTLDFSEGIPTLHCEVTENGKQVRFRCGYCNCYHYHGNIPSDSPDKGHRQAHCHVNPIPYPNGYDLRTNLNEIHRKRYPNFVVINSSEKAFNAHYRKCKRLELPMVAVRCERNFAMVDIDFVTTNYKMNGVLSTMISTVGAEYRRLHQCRIKGKKRQLGYAGVDTREGRETAMFWIYINDAYIMAAVLMPIINNQSYWVRLDSRRWR